MQNTARSSRIMAGNEKKKLFLFAAEKIYICNI